MTDSINDRLRKAAANLPPPDPHKAAQKRREDHDSWELEAIPRLFEEQPSIETFDGRLERITMNVFIGYLRNLGKRLGFDDRRKEITFDGIRLSKDDVSKIYGRAAAIGLEISKEKCRDSVEMVAAENRHDPVERYLNNLSVDDPIDPYSVAERYLHITDKLNQRQVGKWLIGAVQRTFEPGSMMQYILVFLGDEGLLKSWFFRALGGEFFSDSFRDPQSKDFFDWCRNHWILECPEIDKELASKDSSYIKRVLTQQTDDYRSAWGRGEESVPRRSVFAGTSNKRELLKAEGGDRRFWVVEIIKRIDVEALKRDRDRIWAGAVLAYRDGDKPFLTLEEEKEVTDRNKTFSISLLYEDKLVDWLASGDHNAFTVEHALEASGCIANATELKRPERLEAVKVLNRCGYHRGKATVIENGKEVRKNRYVRRGK